MVHLLTLKVQTMPLLAASTELAGRELTRQCPELKRYRWKQLMPALTVGQYRLTREAIGVT